MSNFRIKPEGDGAWLCHYIIAGMAASTAKSWPDCAREGGVWVDNDALKELRDLLLREFPVMRPCRCQVTPADGPEQPQPAQSEPHPDEVRRSCRRYEDMRDKGISISKEVLTLCAAARAWLRDREQRGSAGCDVPDCDKLALARLCSEHAPRRANKQPAVAPSIAQVIEASGAHEVSVSVDLAGWRADALDAAQHSLYEAVADTPDAALRKLYDDAVEELKRQRDEAASKLEKLGVQS